MNQDNIKNIGILGGGQLAMMMTESAIKLGYKVYVLDHNHNCPASKVGAIQILGKYSNSNDIYKFFDSVKIDVLTWDIESINIDAIKTYCPNNIKIFPDLEFLELIQNKWTQKKFYIQNNLPTCKIYNIDTLPTLPFILKTKFGGYDGKGVWIINSIMEMNEIIIHSFLPREQFYVEELIKIKDEFSIILCSGYDNKKNVTVKYYPLTKIIQERGICTITETQCLSEKKDLVIKHKALNICKSLLESLKTFIGKDYIGVLAIEFFITLDNKILINEISPRVHNSAHFTIEGCYTSQFENHIRAITGMKIGNCSLVKPNKKIIMHNILSKGYSDFDNPLYYIDVYKNLDISMHWYNKYPKDIDKFVYKKDRKIGHFTYFTDIKLKKNCMIYVVMGSYSDLNQMKECINILKKYNISHKVDVVSAHRSPKWMFEFAENVEKWGAKIIIAAAGGAAHLPGMIASLTNLPVIGVPIVTKNLGGQDSLYSIVQMPAGVPVATVGIGNSKNAAILAIRMLGNKGILNKIKEENLEKVKYQRNIIKNTNNI